MSTPRRTASAATPSSAGTFRTRDGPPEEFINSFRQDYAEPRGAGFTVTADGARIAGADGEALVRIGLQTQGSGSVGRNDAVLTFVVDVSGSMGEPDGWISCAMPCIP